MNKSESKYFNTAAVNRSTFYLHYENTADLLKETTQYVLERFNAYFSDPDRSITDKFQDCDLQDLVFINKRYLEPYLSFVRDHQRLFLAAMSHPVTFQFDAAFTRLSDRVFDPIMDRFHYPDSSRKYAMLFYLHGITALVTQWVRDGCRKSIDEIVLILHQCIFGAWNPSAIEGLLEQNRH